MKTRLQKVLRVALLAALVSSPSVYGDTIPSTGNVTSEITVDDGSTTTVSTLKIDNSSGDTASLTLDGSNLNVSGNCGYVGYDGEGLLTINGGAIVKFSGTSSFSSSTSSSSYSSVSLVTGYGKNSDGTVEVIGTGSTLKVAKRTLIGGYGQSLLRIRDGATAVFQSFLNAGTESGSNGEIEVTGSGTRLVVTNNSNALFGISGTGSLIISDGASGIFADLLCIAYKDGSTGSAEIIGMDSSLSAKRMHVGHDGSGSLTIADGAMVTVSSKMEIGGTTDQSSSGNGVGVVKVTGVDSELSIGGTLNIGYSKKYGTGSLFISDGGAVNVADTINSYGAILTMDSSSYLTSANFNVGSGATSNLTLGGTNHLGTVSVASDNGVGDLSLTLLASGASVTQGAIVLCDQLSLTSGSTTVATSDSILSWANVNVLLDVSNGVEGLAGERVFLLKEGDEYIDFGDGLIIEGEARNVDKDTYITFTKDVNGNTYTLDYVYDGISLTFANKAVIVPDILPVDDDPSQDTYDVSTKIFSRDVVGSVETNEDQSIYTPNADEIADANKYVVAEGVNGDESDFQIATASYLKETTTVRKDAAGDVMETDIQIDDLGITDLTLYVDDADEKISGGVVGLDREGEETPEGIRSMINNILIDEYGVLTVTDEAVVNADRKIETEHGTIVLDNATMNIGGGNLDKFRENEFVNSSEMDWDGLATSTIEHSTIELSNGSSLNFSKVEDAQVPTTVTVHNSTIDLSDTSSINAGSGVAMTVSDSQISGTGKVSGFTSHDNTYTAGKDNVGVLELMNIASANDTMGTYIVGPKTVSGILNTDTTNVISQLKLSGGTTITNGAFELNVVGDSSLLTDGTSFQVIDLESPLDGGFTSFTETGTPLMDGYVWDYSLLNSDGIVSIILAELGNGTRIANTMYSAAQTVSYVGQVAMDHLSNYYAGKHNFHTTGNNFWVSSLGTYECVGTHKGRTGYTFRSLGYAVGYDRAFSDRVIEGIDVAQTWGKHYPKQGTARYSGGKIDQDALVATLYGMETLMRSADEQDEINLQHYVAYGKVRNKSVKTALFNNKQTTAKWDDDVWSLGARGIWNHQINNHWTLSPFVAVDYEHVSQNDFTERLNNSTAQYKGGSYQNLEVSVGTAASYNIKFKNNMELTPTASIAYVGSVIRDVPTVSVSNANGKSVREKAVNPGRNALEATAGVLWKVSDSTNVSANYSFYAAHDTTSHNANVMVSYAF